MTTNEMMNTIYFANAEFNEGLNLTVRRGSKWHGYAGKVLNAVDATNHKFIGKAHITSTQLRHFPELTAEILEAEHEPKDRTPEGLLESMKNAYPSFDPAEEVTLIWFYMTYK